MKAHVILFVADQQRSTEFYSSVLGITPSLEVPGMTEFSIGETAILGLMPQEGIVRLLGGTIADPALAHEIPRCEVYLVVEDPDRFHERALAAGASELSPLSLRDWGHIAAYCSDLDGHVLAFACPAA